MVKVRRGYRSKNVEYRGAARGGAGGMGGLPFPTGKGGKIGAGAGGMGLIGLIVVIAISVLGGGGSGLDVGGLGLDGGIASSDGTTGAAPERDAFYEAVFDDVQNTWIDIFEAAGEDYRIASLVIFEDAVVTDGCGNASEAVGPFYCPADEKAYFDPDFFDQLAGPQFGAPGDFAIAYVVAHEIAHHIQNVTGVSADVRQRQQGASQADVNDLSIRLELQADCLAGVWAFEASQRPRTLEGNDNLLYLDRGDLSEGLRAAEAVGDDSIQESMGGNVDPHKWNHGSAAQREAWLTLGMDTGNPAVCNDTFNTRASGIEIMPEG